MGICLTHKKIVFSLLFIAALIALLLIYIAKVWGSEEITYFESVQQWAATTAYDLPVFLVEGQTTVGSKTINIATNSGITSSSSVNTCTSDALLCQKIFFVWEISEKEKKKYQWVVIQQINAIDKILLHNRKIRDSLYSVTIHGDKWTRRWWAGKATINIYLRNIRSTEEFRELLTHELGHIVDLGSLTWSSVITQHAFFNLDKTYFSIDDPSIAYYSLSRINNTTKKPNTSALWFVGGYAMGDPFEDFAESFNMYLNHHHVFAILSTSDAVLRQKYLFMDTLFWWKYLKADVDTAARMKHTLETRSWDTTKWY